MSGFKLVAVIPLSGCSTKFRKNLEIGIPYKFYAGYEIKLNKDKSEIISITENKSKQVPENLYHLENGIKLSFSAIVGKNGSGKSTIVELLYYLIYIIGIKKKSINSVLIDLENEHKYASEDYHNLENFITIHNKIKNDIELSEFEKTIHQQDYKDLDIYTFELNKKYTFKKPRKELLNREDIYRYTKNELFDKVINIYNLIEQEREKNQVLIENSLNLSVIYEINNVIHEVNIFNNNFFLRKYIDDRIEEKLDIEKFNLNDFFYSICLNYSHHGLNSKILGNWITKLFHKNDAYTTPVVINPMRNEGNFNINHEVALSKERLLSNIVMDLVNNNENLILGKYKVSKFIFTPKILSPPYPLQYNEEFINDLQSNFIFKQKLKIKKLDEFINYWDFAIAYLEKKIPKIDKNYYSYIHSGKSLGNESDELQNFILTDESHITKKIRQVINFLRISHLKENTSFWKLPETDARAELTPLEMLSWLNLFNLRFEGMIPSKLVEYALPGFFNIDFELEEKNGEKFEFGKLSSGEQQMIFNINSILYHLYNIQSVPNSDKENANEKPTIQRVKYKNINIILDEIELYYHPEMQRLLVKNLIEAFENVRKKNESGIDSINVCFLTHSPFILSDIPSQNILMLKSTKEDTFPELVNEQNFGANIHELLTHSFFMESTTGEFTIMKIKEIVDFYYQVKYADKEKKSLLIKNYEKREIEFEFVVGNIGEDVVRGILKNHLDYIKENLKINNKN